MNRNDEFRNRNLEDVFRNTTVLSSHDFTVAEWTQGGANSKEPCTEVHIIGRVFRYAQMAFVMKLKSRAICQELIDALQEHMNNVWPEA